MLAEFFGCKDVMPIDLEVGEKVVVDIQSIAKPGEPSSQGGWRVNKLYRRRETVSNPMVMYEAFCDDYVGLRVVTTIVQTEFKVYMIAEVVSYSKLDITF